jgi:hypothetical protein
VSDHKESPGSRWDPRLALLFVVLMVVLGAVFVVVGNPVRPSPI